MSNHPSPQRASSAGASEQPLPPSPSSSSTPLSAAAESLRILLLMQFRIRQGRRVIGADAYSLVGQVYTTVENLQRENAMQQATIEQLLAERRLYTPSSAAATPLGDRPADASTSSASSFNLKKRSLGESSSAPSPMGAANAAAATSSLSPETEQPANKKQKRELKGSDESVPVATPSLDVLGGAAMQPLLPAAAASTSASDSASAPAAAPAATFISISVQLVMRFLPLTDVCTCEDVCRSWRSAVASPFIWADRKECLRLRGAADETTDKLARWLTSRVRRNVREVEFDSLFQQQSSQQVTALLDQLQARLPQLNELSFCTEGGSASVPLRHSLLQRAHFLHVTISSSHSFSESSLSWEELMGGLSQCPQLRKLHIMEKASAEDINQQQMWLLERLPQLEEFVLERNIRATRGPFPALRLAQMPHLRILHIPLIVTRVEQLCELGQSEFVSLCELEIKLVHEGVPKKERAEEARAAERAAASLGLPAASRTLLMRRLSCLGRLLSLQRLALQHEDDCDTSCDPMLLLRFARQQDARAFQQLREFTYKKLAALHLSWTTPTEPSCFCKHEEKDALANLPNQRAPLFPTLTAVHLDCCPANLCSGADSPRLDRLCYQLPNVCSLKLKLHWPSRATRRNEDMPSDALAWCRLPSLRKLTHLHTLAVDNPLWRSDLVSTQGLIDLDSLRTLPGLTHLKIAGVCELHGRAELSELLTKRQQ